MAPGGRPQLLTAALLCSAPLHPGCPEGSPLEPPRVWGDSPTPLGGAGTHHS